MEKPAVSPIVFFVVAFCVPSLKADSLGNVNNDTTLPDLLFDRSDITIPLHTSAFFNLRSSEPLSNGVNISFRLSTGQDDRIIVELRTPIVHLPKGDNSSDHWTPVRLTAIAVGHDRILQANCTDADDDSYCRLNVDNARLRIAVVHSLPLVTVIQVVGWIYFVAWSISFYPQMFLNFRRKSVVGLNFDFLDLNATGFLFYSLYNCAMFWIYIVQKQYAIQFPDGINPVQLNDVIFALHALFATLITIAQCFIYERGNQRVSRVAIAILIILWLIAIISVILAGANVMTWLLFFDILSIMKLTITLIKYIPQAYYNYRRKSTAGWSIGNILLDFTGGAMSMLQMFLLSYNNDDWKEIFGDFTKFGLAFISLSFDILFIFQHYVLYRDSVPYDRHGSTFGDGENSEPASIHVPYVDADEQEQS